MPCFRCWIRPKDKKRPALEKNFKKTAAWNQRKAERAEFLANRQKEISAAAASGKETLNTLILYQQYFGPNNRPVDQNADIEPKLTNYNTPSDQTITAEIVGTTIGMALTTYIAYKVGQRN